MIYLMSYYTGVGLPVPRARGSSYSLASAILDFNFKKQPVYSQYFFLPFIPVDLYFTLN